MGKGGSEEIKVEAEEVREDRNGRKGKGGEVLLPQPFSKSALAKGGPIRSVLEIADYNYQTQQCFHQLSTVMTKDVITSIVYM